MIDRTRTNNWFRTSQPIGSTILVPPPVVSTQPMYTSHVTNTMPMFGWPSQVYLPASRGGWVNPEALMSASKGGQLSNQPSGIRLSAQVSNTPIYLQTRLRQPQYPDFLNDNQPTSNIPDFEFASADATFDPQSLLNKQVIYIDQSPQQRQVATTMKSNQRFSDELFPPDYLSLFGSMQQTDEGYDERKQKMTWRSIFEVIPNGQLFTGGIKPNDVHQRQFGNCYYLCSLSALAEHPQRIRDLFLKKTVDGSGIFACSLIFRGRWKTIYLDQNFPLLRSQFISEQSIGTAMGSPGQLWVTVLEKALNKLYGSYFLTEGGFTKEAAHDLTGAHTRFFNLKLSGFDKQNAWKELLEGTKKNFVMTAQSPNGKDTSKTGMVFGHAYTILGAYEVSYLGKVKRLVKCRNPWGSQEWSMEWSDQDSKWTRVSAADRKKVGYVKNPKDGAFFLLYDDLCDWLADISITETHDDYSYVYASQPATSGKGCFFKVTIFKEGEYSFQLNQTPQRLVGNLPYQNATLNIGKLLPNGELEYYKGTQSAYQVVYRKHTLPPGEYLVYAEQSFHKQDPFQEATLAINGQYFCKIEVAPQQLTDKFHNRLLLGRARQVAEQIAPCIYEANEVLKSDGFLYSAVINKTSQAITGDVRAYENLNKEVGKIKDEGGKRKIPASSALMFSSRIPPNEEWVSRLCGFELVQ